MLEHLLVNTPKLCQLILYVYDNIYFIYLYLLSQKSI